MKSSSPIPETDVQPLPRPRKPWYRRYFSILSLLALGVLAYMLFFSESSMMVKFEQQRTIDSLTTEIAACQDSTAKYRELNRRLSTDPEEMERIVREYHNMNRTDEDIYIFESADSVK